MDGYLDQQVPYTLANVRMIVVVFCSRSVSMSRVMSTSRISFSPLARILPSSPTRAVVVVVVLLCV